MNLNKTYGKWLVQHGKGSILQSEIKDGFIIHLIKYRDSYGNIKYGKYRENIEKEILVMKEILEIMMRK